MPGNSQAMIADAQRRFPVRIAIRLPSGGIGSRYKPMTEWLDDNCGINGWAIAPAGMRGIVNDALAVYVGSPTCAVAFVARWCVAGEMPGLYDLRADEPDRRLPAPSHKTP